MAIRNIKPAKWCCCWQIAFSPLVQRSGADLVLPRQRPSCQVLWLTKWPAKNMINYRIICIFCPPNRSRQLSAWVSVSINSLMYSHYLQFWCDIVRPYLLHSLECFVLASDDLRFAQNFHVISNMCLSWHTAVWAASTLCKRYVKIQRGFVYRKGIIWARGTSRLALTTPRQTLYIICLKFE